MSTPSAVTPMSTFAQEASHPGPWFGELHSAIGSSRGDLGLITELMSTQISRLYDSESIRHRRIQGRRSESLNFTWICMSAKAVPAFFIE
jgi:hypothetical protein